MPLSNQVDDPSFWPPLGTKAITMIVPSAGEITVSPYVNTDAAFSKSAFCMKPYPGDSLTEPQLIFNHIQSSTRMCIERTFGQLVARFPIMKYIPFKGKDWREATGDVSKACKILHNLCKRLQDPDFDIEVEEHEEDTEGEEDDQRVDHRRAHDDLREMLTEYLFEHFYWDDVNRTPCSR